MRFAEADFSGVQTHIACPPEHDPLWRFFSQVNKLRGSSGFGVNPIMPTDLLAWSQISGFELLPEHAQILVDLDAVYRSVVSRMTDRDKKDVGRSLLVEADTEDTAGVGRVMDSIGSKVGVVVQRKKKNA
jgi:hypothetical protein